ncbi:prolipoprotein diacylglyceryl transferase family protein [Streptomyces sp. NPDC002514]|uniref:prolipoprotein diacylglyceryl transferase family protein n=1 Tax=unclassified Streptomyces TaxID=2593676 RepID=UPI003691A7F4
MLLASIPSPSVNGFHVGPLFVHFYALMYIVGISLAVLIGRRRWRAAEGDPAMVEEVALWGVPFGLGLSAFAVLSDGSQIDSPRFGAQAPSADLSRKAKGSKNRARARIKIPGRSQAPARAAVDVRGVRHGARP